MLKYVTETNFLLGLETVLTRIPVTALTVDSMYRPWHMTGTMIRHSYPLTETLSTLHVSVCSQELSEVLADLRHLERVQCAHLLVTWDLTIDAKAEVLQFLQEVTHVMELRLKSTGRAFAEHTLKDQLDLNRIMFVDHVCKNHFKWLPHLLAKLSQPKMTYQALRFNLNPLFPCVSKQRRKRSREEY